MNQKRLYDLKEIINFLVQENLLMANDYFKIRLCYQKTNYNLDNQILYLNYEDLYETIIILNNTKKPPFKVQIDFKIEQNYIFDLHNKILFLKQEPKINHNVALNEKLYQKTFSDLECHGKDAYSDLVERNRKKLFGDNDFS